MQHAMMRYQMRIVNKKGEFDDKIRRFDKRVYLFRVKE